MQRKRSSNAKKIPKKENAICDAMKKALEDDYQPGSPPKEVVKEKKKKEKSRLSDQQKFFRAVRHGKEKKAERLLNAEGVVIDVNAKDKKGEIPLNYAVINFLENPEAFYSLIQTLCLAKGDVNLAGESGNTPLHHAAAIHSETLVNFFLDQKARAAQLNDEKVSPHILWNEKRDASLKDIAARARLTNQAEEEIKEAVRLNSKNNRSCC